MFSYSHIDRPSPPRNLAVSDIKAESCYLTWDAPLDNGGSEITHYIIEKRDASRKKSEWEEVSNSAVDRRFGVILLFILYTSLCQHTIKTTSCIDTCASGPFKVCNY